MGLEETITLVSWENRRHCPSSSTPDASEADLIKVGLASGYSR